MFSNETKLTKCCVPSLNQGREFKQDIQKINDLAKDSSHIIEGFTSSTDPLIEKFDKTLSEYTTSYNQYIDNIMKHRNSNLVHYLNHIVTDNKNYYYINKFGYKRLFSDYTSRDVSCQGENKWLISITETLLNEYPEGAVINNDEPCNLEGSNIKNSKNGAISYVDVKGFRHYYSSQVWSSLIKNNLGGKGCSSSYTNLSEKQYLAVSKKEVMTLDSNCLHTTINNTFSPEKIILNLNVNDSKRISELNSQLITIGQEILDKINNNIQTEEDYNEQVESQKKQLQNQLQLLKRERIKFMDVTKTHKTLDYDINNMKTLVTASYVRYLTLGLGTLILVSLTLRHVFKK
uniref:Uncharacterized protein n=1 Tax=viral metagenome TaxID=1070528 RepID=A0A6C0KJ02_9ZZZZ